MERVWRRDNRLRAHVEVGRAGHQLILEVIMEVEIKDTPYNDRCCGNCEHCVKTELRYCLKNHAFVAKNKWCTEWCAEERFNKFEN